MTFSAASITMTYGSKAVDDTSISTSSPAAPENDTLSKYSPDDSFSSVGPRTPAPASATVNNESSSTSSVRTPG